MLEQAKCKKSRTAAFGTLIFPDWRCLYKSKNLHEKALFCHGVAFGKEGECAEVGIEIRRSKISPYFKNSGLTEIRASKTEIAPTFAAASLPPPDTSPSCAKEPQGHGESLARGTALYALPSRKSVSALRFLSYAAFCLGGISS